MGTEPSLAGAASAYQAGRFAEAEEVCEALLAAGSLDFEVLHLSALSSLQQGRLDRAAQRLTQAIGLMPSSRDAHNNLGVVLLGLGRAAEAVPRFREALQADPVFFEGHVNLGNALNTLGAYSEAIASYEAARQLRTDSADLYNNLGTALHADGRIDEAVASYRSAIEIHPSVAGAKRNLAKALKALGRFDEAIQAYRDSIALLPQQPDVCRDLGEILLAVGSLPEAELCFRNLVALEPASADSHCRLGQVLHVLGRLDEARSRFAKAQQIDPECMDALFGSAAISDALGDTAVATEHYEKIIALSPGNAVAHLNLGGIAFRLGRIDEAIEHNREAIAAAPAMSQAYNNLANCYYLLRRYEEAIDYYARALALDPELPNAVGLHQLAKRQICSWSGLDAAESALLRLVKAGQGVVDPFSLLWITDDPALQLSAARQYVAKSMPPVALPPRRPARREGGRIRLAYLSPDFHEHPVGILIADLLEKHDRSKFQISAYSVGPALETSTVRRRVVAAVDRFVDARALSDAELARQIREDDIDLLVDLAGHTHGNRMRALSYKPGRVQIGYLGFSATTGADFLDYALVDRFVVPAEEQVNYTERLYHLPHSYMVNSRTRQASVVTPSRGTCWLPPETFVFCCFNNTYKITPAMFDVWMRLMRAVPGSVLWLKGESQSSMRNLRFEAEKRGVSPERLVFAFNVDYASHLARHRNADLFLDTFPYNAASTAGDALWMGLPIVTLAGRSFVSRVAGSMLFAAGVRELVTHDLHSYEELARELSSNFQRLANLKRRLIEGRTRAPLFDLDRFCVELEQAYLELWQRHLESGR
jgi:protein O-GlcNAc transferase